MIRNVAACKTKEQADGLLRIEAATLMEEKPQLLYEEARAIAVGNVGYLSGYMDRAEAGRILGLFGARHPFFGAIEEWPKTPDETLEMGYKVGMRMRPQGRRTD
jgi:hypothetical protein